MKTAFSQSSRRMKNPVQNTGPGPLRKGTPDRREGKQGIRGPNSRIVSWFIIIKFLGKQCDVFISFCCTRNTFVSLVTVPIAVVVAFKKAVFVLTDFPSQVRKKVCSMMCV